MFFEIHSEEFEEWVLTARSRFEIMVQTLIDVAHLIELNTAHRVPLKTGRLEHSYKFVVTENTSNLIEVEVGYDASDPKSGFVYAEYQHDVIGTHQHPLRGEQFYLTNGIKSSKNEAMRMIETDYLSLFMGVK